MATGGAPETCVMRMVVLKTLLTSLLTAMVRRRKTLRILAEIIARKSAHLRLLKRDSIRQKTLFGNEGPLALSARGPAAKVIVLAAIQ